MPQAEVERKGNEELVLRFFAAKNARHLFKGSVRDWLDRYMEDTILGKLEFEFQKERREFEEVFAYLDGVMGRGAFVKYRDSSPLGGLAPAYFEAVAIGVSQAPREPRIPDHLVRERIIATVQSDDFRENTGPGASNGTKLECRIKLIREAATRPTV